MSGSCEWVFTWGAGADVDHLALGAEVFVVHFERDGLDEHGVLRPGLQGGEQHPGVRVFVRAQLHVHHVPAVRAAAVLTFELRDVLEGSAENTGLYVLIIWSKIAIWTSVVFKSQEARYGFNFLMLL